MSWVVVDGNNYAFRSMSISTPLINKDGKDVTMLHEILTMLKTTIIKENPQKIIFCWDISPSKVKLAEYPEYKANRHSNSDYKSVVIEQIKEIISVFENFGIHQAYVDGIEADDIIWYITNTKVDESGTIVVVSSDKDLLLCLKKGVLIYSPKQKKYFSIQNVEEYLGIPIEKYLDYKVLVGDRSDNINGVDGIGEKTAIEILKVFGSIDKALNSENKFYLAENKRWSKLLGKKNKTIISRNRNIMELGKTLTEENIKDIDKCLNRKVSFNKEKIAKFFEMNYLNSHLSNIDEFERLFSCLK